MRTLFGKILLAWNKSLQNEGLKVSPLLSHTPFIRDNRGLVDGANERVEKVNGKME